MSSTSAVLIPRPANEAQRLQALQRYQILDTPQDAAFDFLTELAAEICQAPFAFVTFVDHDRVWVKSAQGLQVVEIPRDEEYCSWTILQQSHLVISDLSEDPRTASMGLTLGDEGFRMYAGANLTTVDGFNLGTLCVLDKSVHQLTARQEHSLGLLAHQVMALIELRAHERELTNALQKMEKLAMVDELTGLHNRRALFTRLQEEVERSHRYQQPLSLLMLDLDHFKCINDKHGHAAGGHVLQAVGELLRNSLRIIDCAGRYGGEELCVLLPGTQAEGARTVAETLRQCIAAMPLTQGDQILQLTTSIGIACVPDNAPHDVALLLQAADKAVYEAKAGGRNAVVLAPLLTK